MEPLDEMDLSLVLPCPAGFDGPPLPSESHIPAFVLCILQGRVIVLQDDLSEDTVPAAAVGLCVREKRIFFVTVIVRIIS